MKSKGFVVLQYVAAFGLVWLALLSQHQGQRSLDFNLHYAGGLVERQGTSYTDTRAVQKMGSDHNYSVESGLIIGTPELVALVFVPLSLLDRQAANHLWDAFEIVFVAVGIRLACGNIKTWPLWCLLIAFSPSILETFNLDNPAALTFFLAMAAYGAVRVNRYKLGAGIVGAAAMLKIYPVLAFLPFLSKRHIKAIYTGIVVAIVMTLASAALIGPHHLLTGINRILHVANDWAGMNENASLPAVVYRATDNLILYKVTTPLVLIAGFVLWWRIRKFPATQQLAFGLLIALLAQPVTWRMYYAIAILALLESQSNCSIRYQIFAWIFGLLALGYWSYFLDAGSSIGTAIQALSGAALLVMLYMKKPTLTKS